MWKPTVLLRGGWPIRFVADEQMRILAKGISLLDHIMAISKTEKVGHKIWDNQVIKAFGDSKSTAAGGAAGFAEEEEELEDDEELVVELVDPEESVVVVVVVVSVVVVSP